MHEDYQYRDLSRLTAIAAGLVLLHLGVRTLYVVAAIFTGSAGAPEATLTNITALVQLVAYVACVVAVGRWIYCASVNAHSTGEAMAISPGWAVGWYFIPFANLIKPFQAMREMWDVSNGGGGSYGDQAPSILRLWWGSWIVGNILDYASQRLTDPGAAPVANLLIVASLVLGAIASFTLISIMRDMSRAQAVTMQAQVFA